MAEAAGSEDFEEAGRIKYKIESLSAIKENSIRYNPAGELEELRKILNITGPVDIIEAFDVSNIMGKDAVGSMICFYRARPRKSEYRKFRIKTVGGIDDYAMMREIVKRRYSRLAEEKMQMPDLILVDGGKGHLSVTVTELEKLGLGNIPVIGIAKPARPNDAVPSVGRARLTPQRQPGGEIEHIYTKNSDRPITLPKESKALHLLIRIRNEAHRFAISYHKSLLSKKVEFSELNCIPGIGPKRKRSLLKHFGTVEGVKKASLEELLKIGGMDERSVKNIIEYFKR
jgi:excinuclease ABC subunit C